MTEFTVEEVGALVGQLEAQRVAILSNVDRLERAIAKTSKVGMVTARLEAQRAALQDRLGRVQSLIVTARFVAMKKGNVA